MSTRIIAINATLRSAGKAPSSTDATIALVAGYLKEHNAILVEAIWLADHEIHLGVTSGEGEGDAMARDCDEDPRRRRADFGSAIWMRQPSSIAKRRWSGSTPSVSRN